MEGSNDSSKDAVPEVMAEELTEIVISGGEVYAELTEQFIESFQFYGLSLREWTDEMMIRIPNHLNQEEFRKLLIELAQKIQKASAYYSVASSLAKAFGSGSEIRKSDVVAAIVQTYANRNAKRPAATVIERMADSYMKSTLSTRIAAGIVRDFWKQRLETLDQIRKVLEQLGMSLHMEMKHTASY